MTIEESPFSQSSLPYAADAAETLPGAGNDSGERGAIPQIGDIAQSDVPRTVEDDYGDPGEDLKDLSMVRASIRVKTGDEPPDYARAHFSGVPGTTHAVGRNRGWRPIGYGWDAPAMYYQPVYFEEINLERYGIHYGLCSPVFSFGKFFGTFPILPYKLIAQPMCECHYTLGFERPNNCVPVHCFGCGSLNKPLLWWFGRHNYCPIRPACPWTRNCRPCDTECGAFYERESDPDRDQDGAG